MNGKVLLISLIVACCLTASYAQEVIVLTTEDFDQKTAKGEWLLEFYAPWCGHCKRLAPIYDELAAKVGDQYNVAKIDCTKDQALQQRFGIRGFPTIKFLKDGALYDYSGDRTVDAFTKFMEGGYAQGQPQPLPKAAPAAEGAAKVEKSDVVVLTDGNFEELTSKGTWFIKFYAPWCGHCKRMAPIYDEVATALKGKVNVGKMDCTAEKAVCSQYGINGYPTVYHRKGDELREYNGQRNVESFKTYAESGWQQVKAEPVPEPISAWKLALTSAIGQVENLLSVNIWIIVAGCIAVGVVLGLIVVALTPAPQPAPKMVHYDKAPTSESAEGEEEITEEEPSNKQD